MQPLYIARKMPSVEGERERRPIGEFSEEIPRSPDLIRFAPAMNGNVNDAQICHFELRV